MLDRILKLFGRKERDATLNLVPELNLEDLPTLELEEYRGLVAEIPPPTDAQIRNFAVFVSDAKSWYKHIPVFGLGTPFYFFVDPGAGLDRIWVPGGVVTFRARTESTPQFHYTWMTTEHYRARFGWLAFCCEAGSELFLPVSVELDEPVHATVKGLLDNNPSYPVIYRKGFYLA